MSDEKRPSIYGYMRAYDVTPDEEVTKAERQLFHWARAEGYDLAVVYQETDEGSIAVLAELIQELRLRGDRAVVVPSIEHFGSSRLLHDHLYAYVVDCAGSEVLEAKAQ